MADKVGKKASATGKGPAKMGVKRVRGPDKKPRKKKPVAKAKK